MTSEFAFSLQGVEFAYPNATTPALSGIDLKVAQGEWVALLGSNGSGKSTLARVLNALLCPTQGACSVYGKDSLEEQNWQFIRQNVAMVFQNPDDQIVASLVEEDVAFGPENMALPSEEIIKRVESSLRKVGLYEFRDKPTYTLSGGQKQRLAVAGALALCPRTLVLDEATAMLDPYARKELILLLEELNKNGVTLVQITHHLDEVIRADRIILMQNGKISWQGSPSDFFKNKCASSGFVAPTQIQLKDQLVALGYVPQNTIPQSVPLADALCRSLFNN